MTQLPVWDSETILRKRPQVERPTPSDMPITILEEQEASDREGGRARVSVVMLRGSECAFRCLMCDLWKTTYPGRTPEGSLPSQLQHLKTTAAHDDQPQWVKLYNASNFFAPINVPTSDLPRIAAQVRWAERVIVENHPKLLGKPIVRFRDALGGRLEVAMGLETVHPAILSSLNKSMSLDDFRQACDWYRQRDIDTRAFVLLRPPGLDETEAVEWCERSWRFAEANGVRHCTLIPVRSGNGAMDALARSGHFQPPSADALENAFENALRKSAMVVTVDLWDWQSIRGVCPECSEPRRQRLAEMNLSQCIQPRLECHCCQ